MTVIALPDVLKVQARVLGALVLRETRATFGTTQIGYLWAIITPVAMLAVLVAIFTAIGRHPPFGASLALFFATGLLTLHLFTKLSNSLMTVLDANRALLAYPPIKETDTLFARTILIAATHAVIMSIVYGGLIALDMADLPRSPLDLMGAFFTTCLLGFGFGTINAVMQVLWDSWRHIEAILTRPLFFLSAIFYVPSYLPPAAIEWLQWNPVLHSVEWVRTGFYSNYNSVVLDRFYLISCAMVFTLVGLAGERMTRSRRSR